MSCVDTDEIFGPDNRCRSTWPSATRPKTCDAPYINADRLEEAVWKTVREILQEPDIVIAEIKRQQDGSSFVEEELARIRASIRRLADQERRLIRLFGLGQLTEEHVVREAGQVKKARQALESEMTELQQQRQHIASLDGLSEQVRAFCAQVAERLDEFGFDDKRLALQALQIRVVVDRHGARLAGAIPQNLATIEQTSA